jgi:hypothetical protein
MQALSQLSYGPDRNPRMVGKIRVQSDNSRDFPGVTGGS